MILLDASVVIDGLREKNLKLLKTMRVLDGAVCGVTRAEVLSDGRTPDDRTRLVTILNGFAQVAITESMWDEVGSVLAELRAGGITVPLADAVLIVVALALELEVWARDEHFLHAQKLIPKLKLLSETP